MKTYQEKKTEKYSQILNVFNDPNVDNNVKLSSVDEKKYLIDAREKINAYYKLIQATPGVAFDKNIVSLCSMLKEYPNNSNMEIFYKLFIEYLNLMLEELEYLRAAKKVSDTITSELMDVRKYVKQVKDNYNCFGINHPQKNSEGSRGKVIQFSLNKI